MSENLNWNGIGEDLKNALSDALQSGNFKNLNDLVSQTVADAIDEAASIPVWKQRAEEWERKRQSAQEQEKQQYRQWEQQRQEPLRGQRQNPMQRQQQAGPQKPREAQQKQSAPQESSRRTLPAIRINKVGSVSGVLYQVFGGIGLGFSSLAAFIRLFVTLSGKATLAGWIVNLFFIAFFFGMIRFGIGQKHRLRRADRYLQLCDYRVYGEISKLADATGKSEKYVVKDLQKMLALGIFPEGHLDQQKTCFMLNDVVYKQYLETENNRKLREAEQQKALEEKNASQMMKPAPDPESSGEQMTELQDMVAEGAEYIRKLRNLNDKIPGEVISAKLFCLENLLKDIFDGVRTHPEQMPRMHKLMSYYLPTTLKLVESYEAFDKINSPGSDIVKAKAEIENTLDTINEAFRELLNNLFQDAVFDATTDAQVLKSMLAREGLMREMDFTAVREKD